MTCKRIAILSSASDGGAGIAAKRLCDALNATSDCSADFIDIKTIGESIPTEICLSGNMSNQKYTNTHFTGERPGFVRGWVISLLSEYELVNVHWASFLVTTAELIELALRNVKIVITMHDFHYSTGGCHYQAGCSGQRFSCVACPQVDTMRFTHSEVRAAFKEKQKLLSYPNVHLIAPSQYVLDKVIEYGLKLPSQTHNVRNIYAPPTELKRTFERKHAGKIVLISASLEEQRKGMLLAVEALRLLTDQLPETFELHIIGSMSDDFARNLERLNMPVQVHGRLTDHLDIAKVFCQAGILLSCSYEDNWPNVLVEAGAFGVVPVVGSGHGCEEFVSTYRMGESVADYTPKAFTDGIKHVFQNWPSATKLTRYAAKVRDDHAAENVLGEYMQALSALTSPKLNIRRPVNSGRIGAKRLSESHIDIHRIWNEAEKAEPVHGGPYSAVSHAHRRYGFANFTRHGTQD